MPAKVPNEGDMSANLATGYRLLMRSAIIEMVLGNATHYPGYPGYQLLEALALSQTQKSIGTKNLSPPH